MDRELTDAELKGFITGSHGEACGYKATCGKVARLALEAYSQVQELDPEITDAELKGFITGFHEEACGCDESGARLECCNLATWMAGIMRT